MDDIDIAPLEPQMFEPLMRARAYGRFSRALDRASHALRGRTLWEVNSTSDGGRVAEMLRFLVGNLRGAEVDTRWLVSRARTTSST